MKKQILVLLFATVMLIFTPRPALADSVVVGTGSPASCTEAAFNTALAALYPGATAPGGILSFNCGLNPYTLVVTGQKFLYDGTIIDGGGLITLSGGNTTRIFFVTQQARVELHHITLTNGYAAGGGAIYAEPNTSGMYTDLLLNHVTLSLNNSSTFGGAVGAQHTALTVINSHLTQNTSIGGGGAISLNGGVLTMSTSEVLNNTAQDAGGTGGAIDLWNATLDIQTSVLQGNKSMQSAGGAIALRTSTGSIATSQIGQNSAANFGGGIYLNSSSNMELSQVTITSNTAITGAGIVIDNSTILLRGTTLAENIASNGGAIYNFNGQAILQNSILRNNQASYGGGIYSNNILTLVDTAFENNLGVTGGGLYNTKSAVLNRVTFSQNTAGDGGAVFNTSSGLLTLTNATLSGNQANFGGGIFNNGTLTLINGTIASNQALGGGGGVLHNPGADTHLNIVNTIFALNSAIAPNSDQCLLYEPAETLLFSLWSGVSCGSSTANGNLPNTNAQLGPLSFTGTGLPTELTRTRSPLPGSPAQNGGTCGSGAPVIDQRGVARPFGAACDIGAVELVPILHTVYLPIVIR